MNEPAALSATKFDRALVQPGLRLSGRVVAVWEHAALVRAGADGALLTLLHPARPLVPFGIQIPWDALRVHDGETAVLEERRLVIGGRAVGLVGDGVRLTVAHAPFSRDALSAQLAAMSLPPRTRMLLGDEEVLAEPTEVAMVVAARRGLRKLLLAMALPAASAGDFRDAVRSLSGLGPGQTPTGDDLLAGAVAAGHRMAGSGLSGGRNWSLLLEALEDLPAEATTPVAREMLRHAVHGRFAEPLLAFATALGDPEAGDALRAAAGELKKVGAQTGSDWMAGAVALAASLDEARGGGSA